MRRLGLVTLALVACDRLLPYQSPDSHTPDARRDVRARDAFFEPVAPVVDLGQDRPAPPQCPDGTLTQSCSTKPTYLYCDPTGKLVLRCSKCGCPAGACDVAADRCKLTLSPTADACTYWNSWDPQAGDVNAGSNPSLKLFLYGSEQQHAYLDFGGLSALPKIAVVDSAMLTLFYLGWGGRPVDARVELIKDPWDEKTITFNNAPQVLGGGPQPVVQLGTDPNEIDVTAHITTSVSGASVLHGVRLLTVKTARPEPLNCKKDASSCGYSVYLGSKENPDLAKRPKLQVVYH